MSRFATIELTDLTCPSCGVVYALNEQYRKKLRNREGGYDGKGSWYCPNGHSLHYPQETEADKMRARALRLESQLEYERNRRRETEREVITQKGRATRFKNDRDRIKQRVAAGVCPCCNRHFVNLERHMNTKHPTFSLEESETSS